MLSFSSDLIELNPFSFLITSSFKLFGLLIRIASFLSVSDSTGSCLKSSDLTRQLRPFKGSYKPGLRSSTTLFSGLITDVGMYFSVVEFSDKWFWTGGVIGFSGVVSLSVISWKKIINDQKIYTCEFAYVY